MPAEPNDVVVHVNLQFASFWRNLRLTMKTRLAIRTAALVATIAALAAGSFPRPPAQVAGQLHAAEFHAR